MIIKQKYIKQKYTKNNKIKYKHNNTIRAGKPIGAGSYGCVFYPALKCIGDSKKKRNYKYVSKLMEKNEAYNEYDNIEYFKTYISKIPNYEKYFLIDNITICDPMQLTNEDLQDFDKICKNITRENITNNNINDNLKDYKIINIPYGGIDLSDYFSKIKNYNKMIVLNNTLIDLLNNAIVKMNNLGVYHTDLKDNNVIIDIKNNKITAKIIDWGLGIIIPYKLDNIYNNNIRINAPFSIIFFSDIFYKDYNQFLSFNPNPLYNDIHIFMDNYLIKTEGREKTHYKYFIQILNKFDIDTKETNSIIMKYLCDILFKYTYNGIFDIKNYFYNIFLKNMDIFGFITLYLFFPFYLKKKNNIFEIKLYNKIKYIFINYLLNNPLEPININKLNKDLYSINIIFSELYKNGFSL